MTSDLSDEHPVPSRAVRLAWIGIFLALGLASLHWPMLSSGFERIQTDEGDTRINLYALEHGHRWLTGASQHDALFSPPVYFPLEWTGPCTEGLIGLLPFYAIWRMAGAPPDTAYQLWLLSLSSLNFAAALAWLVLGRRQSILPALAGAWLIAFACSRVAQLAHAQLLPVFIPLLALLVVDRLARESSPRLRRMQIISLGVLATWQLYAGTYIAIFTALATLLIAAALLADPAQRRAALSIATRHPIAIVATAAASLAAAAPWLHASWMASEFKSYPPPEEVLMMLPRLSSWLYPAEGSWVYGSLASASFYQSLPLPAEHHLFLGFATTALGFYGCWLGRSIPAVRTIAAAGIGIFCLTTLPGGSATTGWGIRGAASAAAVIAGFALVRRGSRLDGATCFLIGIAFIWLAHCAITGRTTLWMALYDGVPPLRALRAIARFGLFASIPLGLGACLALDRLSRRPYGVALAVALAALCMLEQVTATDSFSKREHRERIERIAKTIPADADAFFYSPIASKRGLWLDQLDGMFAQLALEREIPTLNGNLNVIPIPWQRLSSPNIERPRSRVRLELGLEEWKALHPQLNDLRVSWVQVAEPDSLSPSRPSPRDRER